MASLNSSSAFWLAEIILPSFSQGCQAWFPFFSANLAFFRGEEYMSGFITRQTLFPPADGWDQACHQRAMGQPHSQVASSLPGPLAWTPSRWRRAGQTLGCLQGLTTLYLSLPCHRGSVARAVLLPASAVLGLVWRRRDGLIVCSCLGSARDSGWLGNKAAAWPRGEPADTKPSAAIHHRCEKLAQPGEGSRATFSTATNPPLPCAPGNRFFPG